MRWCENVSLMAFCISLSFQLYTCYLLIASNVEKSTEYASNQYIQICNLKCIFSNFQASSPPITRETCVLWGKEQEALIRIPECGRISPLLWLCGLYSTLLQWTFGHFSASTRHKPERWTAFSLALPLLPLQLEAATHTFMPFAEFPKQLIDIYLGPNLPSSSLNLWNHSNIFN